MKETRVQGRGRLYTRIVANEAPEIFDDVYLGLRAGGAVRKQRRGEPLSAEEEEAIGRWKRPSHGSAAGCRRPARGRLTGQLLRLG